MPASMMSAPTGLRLNVIGSSIATVATGPMPGSTPIRVPTRQPMSAKPRLIGVPATLKPRMMLLNRSTSPLRPDRDRQRKTPDEDRHAYGGQHDRRHSDLDDPHVAARERADNDERGGRDHQPQALRRQGETDERKRHEQE